MLSTMRLEFRQQLVMLLNASGCAAHLSVSLHYTGLAWPAGKLFHHPAVNLPLEGDDLTNRVPEADPTPIIKFRVTMTAKLILDSLPGSSCNKTISASGQYRPVNCPSGRVVLGKRYTSASCDWSPVWSHRPAFEAHLLIQLTIHGLFRRFTIINPCGNCQECCP